LRTAVQENGEYFMSQAYGRSQGGGRGHAHVDACGQRGGSPTTRFYVDFING